MSYRRRAYYRFIPAPYAGALFEVVCTTRSARFGAFSHVLSKRHEAKKSL
jgi:hypothetical protein